MTACRSQGPEHCHIDFIKNLASCTNNKDVFLTILRCHVRAGHIQYLRNLQTDLEDAEGEGAARGTGPGRSSLMAHGSTDFSINQGKTVRH